MGLRTDLADIQISDENFPAFMMGKEVEENLPKNLNLKSYQDTIHCYSLNLNFSGYAMVTSVSTETFKIKILKSL